MAFNVKGLSIDQILAMDARAITSLNLSRTEMATLTSRLASAANKRLKRLEEAGVATQSPAYRMAQAATKNTAGRFSVKGKNVSELKNTFKQLKQFLNPKLKTNEVKGARANAAKMDSLVGGLSEEQKGQFFDALHKLQNNDPMMNEFNYADDEDFIAVLRNGTLQGLDPEELTLLMMDRLDQIYEERQNAKTDNSGFYPVDDFSDISST